MRRLKRTIRMLMLTGLFLAPHSAFAEWVVTYLAPGDPGGFYGDGAYQFQLSGGLVYTYVHRTNWVGLGVYGETAETLPAGIPTITLSAAYPNAVAVNAPPAPWTVTWYGSADEAATALTLLPAAKQADAKLIVLPAAGKTPVRFGLVHP